MERASPVELRRSLETANLFVKTGIPFICVPYTNNDERDELVARVNSAIDKMEKMNEHAQNSSDAP